MEQSARILVIDDELGMREGCRRALAPLGHQVDVAADGEEGLQKLLVAPYDLVLLDVRMPKIGGMELLQKIRAYDPDAVCIIITGYASIDLAIQAIKQGAYNFISKPFDTDTLVMSVNQGLEKRRLSEEAKRLHHIEAQAAELARAKADLEKLDRVKSEFMLIVAHELRAPVAALQGYLQIILDGYVSAEKQRPMLRRAGERAGELLTFIDEMLQLARIKGAAQDRTQAVDVAQVLEHTAGLLRVEAERHNIALDLQIDARPQLVANPDHVRQLWTNLISNAIKYTPSGGQVRVSLRTDGAKAIVGCVEDTGIGIGPKELPHIFNEFYRSEAAKALVARGTGLGLAIVKRILDTYGGSIQVTSREGKGSTFTFTLPANQAEPEGTDGARSSPFSSPSSASSTSSLGWLIAES